MINMRADGNGRVSGQLGVPSSFGASPLNSKGVASSNLRNLATIEHPKRLARYYAGEP